MKKTHLLRPDIMVKGIIDININMLNELKCEYLFIDADNTLMPWSSRIVSEEVVNWIDRMNKEGYKLCILSNGQRDRIRFVADSLNIKMSPSVGKPFPRAFKIALRHMNAKSDNSIMIGDQLFTDILGANIIGMKTILVEPISDNDMFLTKVNRFIERLFTKRRI